MAALLALFPAVQAFARTQDADRDTLDRLIAGLGADSYDERERAQARILEFGPRVLPDLRRRAADSALDPETRSRLQAILERLTSPTLTPTGSWDLAEIPNSAALAPDRGVVALGFSTSLRFFDAKTGRETLRADAPGPQVLGLDFSPDGRHLVASDSKLRLLHPATLREVELLDSDTNGHGPIFIDDRHVAYGKGMDVVIRSLDDRRAVISRPSVVLSVGANPKGDRLAVMTQGGGLEVFDVETRRSVATLIPEPPPQGAVAYQRSLFRRVEFSPDAKFVAVGHQDGSSAVFRMEDGKKAAEWKPHAELKTAYPLYTFSADSRFLLSAGADGELRAWEAPQFDLAASMKITGLPWFLLPPTRDGLLMLGCLKLKGRGCAVQLCKTPPAR